MCKTLILISRFLFTTINFDNMIGIFILKKSNITSLLITFNRPIPIYDCTRTEFNSNEMDNNLRYNGWISTQHCRFLPSIINTG